MKIIRETRTGYSCQEAYCGRVGVKHVLVNGAGWKAVWFCDEHVLGLTKLEMPKEKFTLYEVTDSGRPWRVQDKHGDFVAGVDTKAQAEAVAKALNDLEEA